MKRFSVVISKLEYATVEVEAESIDAAIDEVEGWDHLAFDDLEWKPAEDQPYAVEQVDEIADDSEEELCSFITPTVAVCNKMIDMWDELRTRVNELPADDTLAFILLWQDHFEKYGEAISEFSLLKQDIDKKKMECMATSILANEK